MKLLIIAALTFYANNCLCESIEECVELGELSEKYYSTLNNSIGNNKLLQKGLAKLSSAADSLASKDDTLYEILITAKSLDIESKAINAAVYAQCTGASVFNMEKLKTCNSSYKELDDIFTCLVADTSS